MKIKFKYKINNKRCEYIFTPFIIYFIFVEPTIILPNRTIEYVGHRIPIKSFLTKNPILLKNSFIIYTSWYKN